LRDKVAFELGIAPSTDVNPMTAVAEGAAVFAESIDWASQSRGRKSARGAISAGGALDLSFNYIARTPEPRPRSLPSWAHARLRASSSRSTAWTRVGRLAAWR
jgi:molecular chaperone DnaK